MSTSTSPELGKLLLKDPPEALRRKIMSAVTDTGREVRRAPDKPGITNLIDILSVATGRSTAQIEKDYDGQGYGQFKKDVAEAVVACLDPVRTRFEELMGDPAQLQRLLAEGARKAAEASTPTLRAMYDRMGFTSA
jgi:tryptophanyl-tRNA synthetase